MKKIAFIILWFFPFIVFSQPFILISGGAGLSYNEYHYLTNNVNLMKPWIGADIIINAGYKYKVLELSVGLGDAIKSYNLQLPGETLSRKYYDNFFQLPLNIEVHKKFGLVVSFINNFYIGNNDLYSNFIPEAGVGLAYHKKNCKISLEFDREITNRYSADISSFGLKSYYNLLLFKLGYYIGLKKTK